MYAPDTPASRPPKEIWEIARSQLRLQMTKSTYETWVRDTSCLACEDGAFVIGVNNAYAKDWLSLRLRPTIKRTLTSIVGHAVDVSLLSFSRSRSSMRRKRHRCRCLIPAADPPAGNSYDAGNRAHEAAESEPPHTFDNFIVGSSNRMAHAVALSVSERPGNAYNPLFLYGGGGLGKTHLLQAIGHVAQSEVNGCSTSRRSFSPTS